MDFGFREPQRAYDSGSQRAKVWTEQWVADNLYCPNCGNPSISQMPPNLPVADFLCISCEDQFELKSQKKPFGSRLANGAYATKRERLQSATNPNLILLNYDVDDRAVRNVSVIPKHFFVTDVVQERKPLSASARRAGWIGSNILLDRIPESGRIAIVRQGIAVPREDVLAAWRSTRFLRQQSLANRGWLLEVMRSIEMIGRREFSIEDVYAFEHALSGIYPNNQNVRPKIRQQLQVLRDHGFIAFLGNGKYYLR